MTNQTRITKNELAAIVLFNLADECESDLEPSCGNSSNKEDESYSDDSILTAEGSTEVYASDQDDVINDATKNW